MPAESGSEAGAGTAAHDVVPVAAAGAKETNSIDPSILADIAAEVAAAASDLVRRQLGASHAFDTKSTPTDIVTRTDVEVETFIRARLLAATPGAAVRGEEGGQVSGSSSIGWIVDPIDGTVNFLYDLPVVSVSIAATVEGEVVAGAVADVVRCEVFRGSVGKGVWQGDRRCLPSTTGELGEALVGTGFSYVADARRREGDVVARILPVARDIRCFGSAALHLCWVACGRLEAFYQAGLQEWDVAAGAFLAREAGARVELGSEANGELILAATEGVFAPLRALIVGAP